MGTKVRFDNHYSMMDLNRDSNGANWPLYCGENSLPNGQYYYNPLPRPTPELFLGVDKDLLKQKMLEHEAMFKNQVYELHRLYRVQKDLMCEVRKKKQYNQTAPCDTSSSSFLFPGSACVGPPVSDPESIGSSTGGPFKGKSVQGGPNNSEASKAGPKRSRKMIDLRLPADEYDDTDEVEQLSPKPESCFRKLNALADLNEPLECEDAFGSASFSFFGPQNRKFPTQVPGVSEDFLRRSMLGNVDGAKCNSHHTDRTKGQNWFTSMLEAGGAKDNGKSIHQANNSELSHHVKEDLCPAKADYSDKGKIGSPRSNSNAGLDYMSSSHGNKGTHALDLNAVVDDLSDDLKREDPASLPPWLRNTNGGKKKLLFDMNLPCVDDPGEFDNFAPTSEIAPLEGKMEAARPDGFRPMIDLNSCLTEDEIPSFAGGMKIPERGVIDLEAPVDLEAEVEDEELVTVAAEAIVAISSLVPDPRVDKTSEDALRWFADLVCSNLDENVDSISDESDYFEEMTLKLTECTADDYLPNPPSFDIPTGPASMAGGPRRGPTRRGRQRRDFQRDILPGLTSLARHEVSEDLQAFGGLMKATGHAWQSGSRRNSSGRGRRRKVLEVSPPPPPPPPAKVVESEVVVLEGRSLTSWGKTTRRPRRQRCPAAAGKGELLPV